MRGFRFPLFVDLKDKRAVVVGGGTVACRRAAVLRDFGARVTMIAPALLEPPEGISQLARRYAHGDLAGAFLAVAATDDRDVNRAVGEEAGALGIPVSVADAPGECTFFFPAICLGEGVVAGVVSRGNDHKKTARAAQRVREAWRDLE